MGEVCFDLSLDLECYRCGRAVRGQGKGAVRAVYEYAEEGCCRGSWCNDKRAVNFSMSITIACADPDDGLPTGSSQSMLCRMASSRSGACTGRAEYPRHALA